MRNTHNRDEGLDRPFQPPVPPTSTPEAFQKRFPGLLTRLESPKPMSKGRMIGASFSFAVTADYNEGSANLWLRYFFEQRRGLFRTDLLGFDNY